MPELPEVETIRQRLDERLRGADVTAVRIARADVIRGARTPAALLKGRTLGHFERHGKQLAITTQGDARVSVHLGMSGSLDLAQPGAPRPPHTHVIWVCDNDLELRFCDPRRFGGIWTHPNRQHLLDTRWNALGPDAAALTPRQLAACCSGRTGPVKGVLLNQALLAGVGNIYADEALHAAHISPHRPAERLTPDDHRALATQIRKVLRNAIRAGGSTIRDYRTPDGGAGGYAKAHAVYGRAGQACQRCGHVLTGSRLAGRATVHCGVCQT